MIKEYTKDGLKITHPSGVIIIHTKEQLQSQVTSNQQTIDLLANDNLRLQNDIDQITAAEQAAIEK
ncbi:MAG: hypothetical protein PHF37_00515 [Phycisphaerae bacterium]|nr:hypothetical protein [Phycisphaerae bacterium]